MKKLVFIAIFATLWTSNFVFAQLRVGIRGGLQLADMRNKPDDRTGLNDDTKMRLGYQLGVVFDYSFNNIIFFQPAIQINSKGSKIVETNNILNTKYTFQNSPLYVDVPLLLGLRFGLKGFKIFGMGGPYLAYGIGGKNYSRLDTPIGYTESETQIRWGNKTTLSDPKDLRPLDLGLVISAGVELTNLQIGLHYTPSFTNIAPDGSGRKLYNTVVGINATLLFGGGGGGVARFL
ncbi:MAG: porin family protein [Raineya sp.]|nr:porin family protein [Raineya sp.]